MKSSLLLLLLAPSLLFATAVSTGWQSIPSTNFEMATFPTEGSAAFDKDFEIMLKAQAERTPQDCAQGRRMRIPQFSVLFKSEILDVTEMALVRPLMDQVATFSERVAIYHKNHFDRARPYDENKKIKPCAEKPGGAKSYPSSHSAIAVAVACVLTEIFPDKEKDLKDFGRWLSGLRYVIGLHHPSDVKAGMKLGKDICDRLMSEPDFKEQVRELKKAAAFQQN